MKEKEKLEYRLGTIEDKFPEGEAAVRIEDVLSISEFNAINKAIDQLYEYKSNKQLIEIVLLNNSEMHHYFSETFEELLQKSISWLGIKDDDLEEVQLHCNRMLLNFLSSIRTYVDHTQHFLSSKFGKESKQYKKFDDLLRFNFDNNFCFRFFSRLRNYSQHCGKPIQTINYTSEYDRENHEIRGHLNAYFKADILLEGYDGWGKLLKGELQAMTEPFELRALRESMAAIMFNLNYTFGEILAPQTRKAARYLYNKVKHLEEEKKEICVFDLKVDLEINKYKNLANRPIPMKLVKLLMEK